MHTGRSSQRVRSSKAGENGAITDRPSQTQRSNWLDLINEKKDASSNSNLQNLGQKIHSKPSSFSENTSHYSPRSSNSFERDIDHVDIQNKLKSVSRPRAEGEGENEKSSQSLNKQQSLHKLPDMIEQDSAKSESEKSQKHLNKNKGMSSLLESQLPKHQPDEHKGDPKSADLNDIRSEDYFTKHAKTQN